MSAIEDCTPLWLSSSCRYAGLVRKSPAPSAPSIVAPKRTPAKPAVIHVERAILGLFPHTCLASDPTARSPIYCGVKIESGTGTLI